MPATVETDPRSAGLLEAAFLRQGGDPGRRRRQRLETLPAGDGSKIAGRHGLKAPQSGKISVYRLRKAHGGTVALQQALGLSGREVIKPSLHIETTKRRLVHAVHQIC